MAADAAEGNRVCRCALLCRWTEEVVEAEGGVAGGGAAVAGVLMMMPDWEQHSISVGVQFVFLN